MQPCGALIRADVCHQVGSESLRQIGMQSRLTRGQTAARPRSVCERCPERCRAIPCTVTGLTVPATVHSRTISRTLRRWSIDRPGHRRTVYGQECAIRCSASGSTVPGTVPLAGDGAGGWTVTVHNGTFVAALDERCRPKRQRRPQPGPPPPPPPPAGGRSHRAPSDDHRCSRGHQAVTAGRLAAIRPACGSLPGARGIRVG